MAEWFHTFVLQAEKLQGYNERIPDSQPHQWPTKGIALELLPSTLSHTQEQGLKGGSASIKRTLILLVKIRLGKEEQNNFVFPSCNALMAEPLRKLENEFLFFFS